MPINSDDLTCNPKLMSNVHISDSVSSLYFIFEQIFFLFFCTLNHSIKVQSCSVSKVYFQCEITTTKLIDGNHSNRNVAVDLYRKVEKSNNYCSFIVHITINHSLFRKFIFILTIFMKWYKKHANKNQINFRQFTIESSNLLCVCVFSKCFNIVNTIIMCCNKTMHLAMDKRHRVQSNYIMNNMALLNYE